MTVNVSGKPPSKIPSKMPGNHSTDSKVKKDNKLKPVETVRCKILKYNEKTRNQDLDSKTTELSKIKTIQEKLLSKMEPTQVK